MPRDVLHGLHHAGEELAVLLAARRKGNAAVPEQGGGDAVPGDRRHVRIPADLGVEVGMQVDEPRRHGMAGRVDFLAPLAADFADGADGVAVDGDVAFERLVAGAVDNGSVADH